MFTIGVIMFGFILFVMITKLNIEITYKHDEDDDRLIVQVFAWKVKWYTWTTPVIAIDKQSPSLIMKKKNRSVLGKDKEKVKITRRTIKKYIKNVQRILERIVGFQQIMKRFLCKVQIKHFEWKSFVGTTDAALTGTLLGVIWAIKGGIVGLLSFYLQIREDPQIHVNADFQNKQSKTSLSCIISFRVGHAIIALLMIIKQWKRKPLAYKTSEQMTS